MPKGIWVPQGITGWGLFGSRPEVNFIEQFCLSFRSLGKGGWNCSMMAIRKFMKETLLILLLISIVALGIALVWKFSEMSAEKLKNHIPPVNAVIDLTK
jgi:hypothetical protein